VTLHCKQEEKNNEFYYAMDSEVESLIYEVSFIIEDLEQYSS